MKLKVYMSLDNSVINLDYRKNVLHVLKSALETLGGTVLEKYYKDTITKPFTFNVVLNKPTMSHSVKMITMKSNEMILNFSCSSEAFSDFYDGFYNLKESGKEFHFGFDTIAKVKKIEIVKTSAITTNTCTYSIKSPICCRKHEKDYTYYYTPDDAEFEKTFYYVLGRQLAEAGFSNKDIESVKLVDIKHKNVYILFYDFSIKSFIGTITLSGPSKILNYLSEVGILSKHSAGFGYIEPIHNYVNEV